ncbi:MAG: nitrite reductase small subunit NirD [Thiotrichales bacterium]|nr:nitrite reductase small subunit NirD [Thiotrichales bacterium]
MAQWVLVCPVTALVKDAGVAALVKGQQIALFYLGGVVYATGNLDPIRQSNVMSRGMTGDSEGELFVASPLHKERYSLTTGQCLDKQAYRIAIYPSRIEADQVWLAI